MNEDYIDEKDIKTDKSVKVGLGVAGGLAAVSGALYGLNKVINNETLNGTPSTNNVTNTQVIEVPLPEQLQAVDNTAKIAQKTVVGVVPTLDTTTPPLAPPTSPVVVSKTPVTIPATTPEIRLAASEPITNSISPTSPVITNTTSSTNPSQTSPVVTEDSLNGPARASVSQTQSTIIGKHDDNSGSSFTSVSSSNTVSGATFKISEQEIQENIVKIKNATVRLEDLWNSISQDIHKLGKVWDGADAAKYNEKLLKDAEKISGIYKSLILLSDTYQKILKEYQDTKNTVKNDLNNI